MFRAAAIAFGRLERADCFARSTSLALDYRRTYRCKSKPWLIRFTFVSRDSNRRDSDFIHPSEKNLLRRNNNRVPDTVPKDKSESSARIFSRSLGNSYKYPNESPNHILPFEMMERRGGAVLFRLVLVVAVFLGKKETSEFLSRSRGTIRRPKRFPPKRKSIKETFEFVESFWFGWNPAAEIFEVEFDEGAPKIFIEKKGRFWK